ncbi:MAG: hypothetical protein MJA30_03425 [Cytophagales bacterium]|nr:hypothetical protein [Cytophagales bacterium]
MNDFLSTDSLVMALFNSLWQGFLVYIALHLLFYISRIHSAHVRYALGQVSLVLLFGWILMTYRAGLAPLAGDYGNMNPPFFTGTLEALPAIAEQGPMTALDWVQNNSLYVVYAWLFGVVIFMTRFFGSLFYVNRMNRQAYAVEDPLRLTLEKLRKGLNIKRKVVLKLSDQIAVPLTSRVFKPIILLPASLITSLSPRQIEVILLHELAHIKRYDYLINLLQHVVEMLFFFNPFVWLLSDLIRRERECCCDDMVVRSFHDKATYVKTLTHLEEARWKPPHSALAFTGGRKVLLDRVKRIMEGRPPAAGLRHGILLITVMALTGFTVYKFNLPSAGGKTVMGGDYTEQPAKTPTHITTGGIAGSKQAVAGIDHRVLARMTSPGDTIILDPTSSIEQDLVEKIKERFPTFYLQNKEEFEQVVLELHLASREEELQALLENQKNVQEERLKIFAQEHEEMQRLEQEMARQLSQQNLQKNVQIKKELAQRRYEELKAIEEELGRMKAQLQAQTKLVEQESLLKYQLRAMELELQAAQRMLELKLQEKRAQADHDRLTEHEKVKESLYNELALELIRDGYFTKKEKIKALSFPKDGDIIINGKKIKEKHKEKYRKIKNKYLKGDLVKVDDGTRKMKEKEKQRKQ